MLIAIFIERKRIVAMSAHNVAAGRATLPYSIDLSHVYANVRVEFAANARLSKNGLPRKGARKP